MGNVFDVNPDNTWASLKTLIENHGEICKITVLGHTLVFVGSVELAEELCDQKRFRKFVGGPIVEIRLAFLSISQMRWEEIDINQSRSPRCPLHRLRS